MMNNSIFRSPSSSSTENYYEPSKNFYYDVEGHHLSDGEDDMNDEDENGNSSLIFATICGQGELVRTLVDQGAFVNHQNRNGETALFWAASQGFDSIAQFLIENGANLNISNLDGASAIHMAAANGHMVVLERLVRRGGYINIQDEDKDTPLHYAVREGRQDIVEFLINVPNVKIDMKNEDLETPLELAQCLESCCLESSYDAIIKVLSSRSSYSSPPFIGFNTKRTLVH